MNMTDNVNMLSLKGPALEHALREKLPEVLAETGWSGMWIQKTRSGANDPGYDGAFELLTPAGEAVRLLVDVKHDLRPCAFDHRVMMRLSAVAKPWTVPVLAVPAMSKRLADLCRDRNVSWYDLAGNCRIDLPGLLFIERRGLPPVYRPPRARANLGSAAAGRVLRALLSPEHAGRAWSHRALRSETVWGQLPGDEPVSLGLVNKVLKHLRDENFIEDADSGGVCVRDPRGLLEAWNAAYRFDQHQRLDCFTLMKGAELEQALGKVHLLAGGMVVYASFSAAERQAPSVRQARTWLYAAPHCIDDLLKTTSAKSVDSGENLVVLVPADFGVLLTFQPGEPDDRRLRPTDPAQTYVDLRHSGGRGDEAAQALLEQVLLPAWKNGGCS
jgi:hypothetical protein